MLTFGFSILPCANAANGRQRAMAAQTETAKLRRDFMIPPEGCVGEDGMFAGLRRTVSLGRRRCSHRVGGVSTTRPVQRGSVLMQSSGGQDIIHIFPTASDNA